MLRVLHALVMWFGRGKDEGILFLQSCQIPPEVMALHPPLATGRNLLPHVEE